LAKVQRRLVCKGAWYDIEYAIRADGSSPARAFLDALKTGNWAPDPDAEKLPDIDQVNDRDQLLTMCMDLATLGVPPHRGAVNFLSDGIWEFKRGSKRMTFFDTRGDGTYSAKNRITDRHRSPYPDDDDWWFFPVFDKTIRLGHCFPKLGQATEKFDLSEAFAVRREDLSHDS
jgi:hypothetical protein